MNYSSYLLIIISFSSSNYFLSDFWKALYAVSLFENIYSLLVTCARKLRVCWICHKQPTESVDNVFNIYSYNKALANEQAGVVSEERESI